MSSPPSVTAASMQPQPSRLLDLPLELRYMIYDELTEVHTKHHRVVSILDRPGPRTRSYQGPQPTPSNLLIVVRSLPVVNLLSTCKQVQMEVAEHLRSKKAAPKLQALEAEPPRLILEDKFNNTFCKWWLQAFLNTLGRAAYEPQNLHRVQQHPLLTIWLAKIRHNRALHGTQAKDSQIAIRQLFRETSSGASRRAEAMAEVSETAMGNLHDLRRPERLGWVGGTSAIPELFRWITRDSGEALVDCLVEDAEWQENWEEDERKI
ncbi:unnamed protein product [Periconia digitata]|uniref:Uncharacterized protein n=1 Tax=Periconia digitata TaxID=1303443 RepID=A0A9W4UHX3_9PLEO|nr:unnamed protein product [Periconia digitata]